MKGKWCKVASSPRRLRQNEKKTVKNGLLVEAAGFSPKVNILTLAAYERARRALRGECEPNSRAGKMRTNISNKPSANIVEMREVGSRPRRIRQNEKRPSKTVFLVEVAGLELAASSSRRNTPSFFDYFC